LPFAGALPSVPGAFVYVSDFAALLFAPVFAGPAVLGATLWTPALWLMLLLLLVLDAPSIFIG
jgi:hypothetical protein